MQILTGRSTTPRPGRCEGPKVVRRREERGEREGQSQISEAGREAGGQEDRQVQRVQVLKALGPWVAVEPLPVTRHGSLYLPGSIKASAVYPGRVLAFGTAIKDAPFEVGSYVLVEMLSGHPHVAGRGRPYFRNGQWNQGKLQVANIDASLFGEAANPRRQVALVPYLTEPLEPQEMDEIAVRVQATAAKIQADHIENKADLDDELTRSTIEYLAYLKAQHEVLEAQREGRRRSSLMKPGFDPASGEGIVAVLDDLDDLLDLGVDSAFLSQLPEVQRAREAM